MYRTWWLRISASENGFESGKINLYQTLLAKPADGHSNLPLSRAHLFV